MMAQYKERPGGSRTIEPKQPKEKTKDKPKETKTITEDAKHGS